MRRVDSVATSPRSLALLLTAAVTPAAVPALKRLNPAVRAADYRGALRWWKDRAALFEQIIWLESSGSDLAHAIADSYRDEIVSAVGLVVGFPAHRGKGYGETLLLEHAASMHIDSTHLVKCTGRIRVANAKALLAAVTPSTEIMVRMGKDLAYVDTRFFVIARPLLDRFLAGLKESIDDEAGVPFERAVALRVLKLASEGVRVTFWPTPPRYIGTGGASDRRYDSLAARLKWPVRSVLYRTKRLGDYLA